MFSNGNKICLKHKKELIIEPEDFDLGTGHLFCPICLQEAKIAFLYVRDNSGETKFYTQKSPIGIVQS